MVSRRIALAAVLAIALLSAGCLSGGPGTDTTGPDADRQTLTTDGPTPTDDVSPDDGTPTDRGTPTDDAAPTENRTVPGWEHAANQPDANKSVTLENRWNRTATMHVRVIRNATGDIVHNETYELAPGAEREVYHTAAADPDGIETFTIVVSARNATESVAIETNECYGGAYAEIEDDGTLDAYYAIC